MSYPELKRGDRGEGVFQLQSFLNRVGAMLTADGDFGPSTELGVRYAQDYGCQPVTGRAETRLWTWLASIPEPFPALDTNGLAFIAQEETGGLAYYNTNTRWPHFPGEASGITIGVGYDLRMNTREDFYSAWGGVLPDNVLAELSSDIGRRGTKARATELRQLGITVPFKAAWPVFVEKTMPRYYEDTQAIYPSLDRMDGLCRSVLVSLVFNRGNDLKGERRREMREIQAILNDADREGLDEEQITSILAGVEDRIVAMKRLWDPGSGLIKRRQAEANLWRAGLARWRQET